ncbi:MAG: hypothetical protein AVO33_01470 [delta proteobacterium ML8_F1]|nr:MAG: hypothetical protein AVO33_01470 [delta proteobacterium ML8_F1]
MKITDVVHRVDTQEKIKGTAQYIEDIHFEGLHYARTLRSTIARGRILSVTYPEGYPSITVVDARDSIARNEVSMITADMPIFARDEVHYIGEPIALVVGRDKDEIIAFMKEIDVVYEPMTPLFTCDDNEANVFTRRHYSKGDLASLEGCEVFEAHYKTPYQEQLYMEKQGIVALVAGETVEIYGSMQCPYYVVNALKNALGYPEEKIRVVQTVTGGAFGGKEDYPSIMACQTALAALKIGAPVQLVYDRREDIQFTTKRHPAFITVTSYTREGHVEGMKIAVKIDAGPYLGLSDVVLQRAILTMTGAYQIPHLEVAGTVYKTNNIFNGAFRGFGGPQSLFALETHMSRLAKRLGKDPLTFREEHFVHQGELTSTGGRFHEAIHLEEMSRMLKEMSGYPELDTEGHGRLVGHGVAVVPHGGGFTGDGEAEHIKAVVKLRKDTEQFIHILVSNVEMGQGALTALSKIVASALDVPLERIVYNNPDTRVVPDSGPTAASRTTMVVGRLLYNAALKMKEALQEQEEVVVTEHYRQPDYLEWDQEQLKGNAYLSYSWAALLARVEVDPVTYEVTCTDLYGVYDVGMPIDEKMLLGQVHGGVVQGLGYGMMEYMDSKDGLIQHNSFSSYAVPTTMDIPQIHTRWLINPYIEGPFGAKAAGELTLVGVAPAIATAVADALDREISEIPVLPENLLKVVTS